jgi:hypothetical protein
MERKKMSLLKQWFPITIGILVVAAIVLVILIFSGRDHDAPKGKIFLELGDSRIQSGRSTQLFISAQNTGNTALVGRFDVSVDDPSSVSISHPDAELLRFNLLPGDSIRRSVDVTASSVAYRTDYEIKVAVLDVNGTVLGTESIILSVRR